MAVADDDFQVISAQVEDLQTYCDQNFKKISSLEDEEYYELFSQYTYIAQTASPQEDALDVICFVYLSDSCMIAGFSVDFVNCTPQQILDVIANMAKTGSMAISFIYMATLEEAQWIRSGKIYFHDQ